MNYNDFYWYLSHSHCYVVIMILKNYTKSEIYIGEKNVNWMSLKRYYKSVKMLQLSIVLWYMCSEYWDIVRNRCVLKPTDILLHSNVNVLKMLVQNGLQTSNSRSEVQHKISHYKGYKSSTGIVQFLEGLGHQWNEIFYKLFHDSSFSICPLVSFERYALHWSLNWH